MDFFRSQWAPVKSVQPEFQFKTPEARRAPKVVQIPVHFVGSEATRSSSALKIQKVLRGYLVRKSVKRILGLKREVEAIQARVSQRGVVDLIRKSAKERLKVNETLMALLLKLDAVSVSGGVDSGIRVCRKAVIRKAIALQERVDSIANDETEENNNDAVVKENLNDGKVEVEDGVNWDESTSNTWSNSKEEDDEDGCGSAEVEVEQKVAESCEKDSEIVGGDDAAAAVPEAESLWMMEEEVTEEERCVKSPGLSECVEMGHDEEEGIDNASEEMMGGGDQKDGGGEDDDGDVNEKKEDVLEKMVEENGKMMKMMTELFERNEAQAWMLNTLTHRLEQLEKAFVCDKIRRKKKRHCSEKNN